LFLPFDGEAERIDNAATVQPSLQAFLIVDMREDIVLVDNTFQAERRRRPRGSRCRAKTIGSGGFGLAVAPVLSGKETAVFGVHGWLFSLNVLMF